MKKMLRYSIRCLWVNHSRKKKNVDLKRRMKYCVIKNIINERFFFLLKFNELTQLTNFKSERPKNAIKP